MTTREVAVPGPARLGPEAHVFARQLAELTKLSVVQELAARLDPESFPVASRGDRRGKRNPGRIVAEYLSSPARSGTRSSKSKQTVRDPNAVLGELYDHGGLALAKKHAVLLTSPLTPLEQVDLVERFREFEPVLRLAASQRARRPRPVSESGPSAIRKIARGWRDAVDGAHHVREILGVDEGDEDDGPDNPEPEDVVLDGGLQFRVHRVKCVDETDPEGAGDDEIAIGAVMTAPGETVTTVPERMVSSDFDDGEVTTYSPPLVLHRFALDGLEAPADFLALVALAEKDAGGFSEFLSELWEAVRDDVALIIGALAAALGAEIGGAIGGSLGTTIGGPIGAVLGAIVGAVIGALVAWLIAALKDDVFPPQSAALRLPAVDSTFEGGSSTSNVETLTFEAHGGKYTVAYSWRLVR